MNLVNILLKYLSSIIIASVGILLTLSGLAIGFMPEANPMSREYGGIISIMLSILGLGTMIYSRIYFKKRNTE